MKLRTFAALAAAAAVLALASPCFAQSSHFALGTSSSNIYILREGETWAGGQSVISVYNAGTALSGIAVRGNWVFAADNVANQLVVGRLESVLGSPHLSNIKTIDLGISKPTSVALDGNGGVYVIGSDISGGNSYYAYVTAAGGDWTGSASVLTGDMNGSLLADIAGLGADGAIIACDKTVGTDPRVTHVTSVTGATPGATDQVNGTYRPSLPSAIAVLEGVSPVAYIASRVGLEGTDIYGTLEAVSTESGHSVLDSRKLDLDFNPEDVAVFSIDGENYLSIIGRPRHQEQQDPPGNNNAQAWRIKLSATGTPIWATRESYRFAGDALGGQRCAVSGDGEVFWSTHVGLTGVKSTVYALDASSWSTDLWDFSSTKTLGIANIAAYNYVPEPSSLAALAAFAGLFTGCVRRRRR